MSYRVHMLVSLALLFVGAALVLGAYTSRLGAYGWPIAIVGTLLAAGFAAFGAPERPERRTSTDASQGGSRATDSDGTSAKLPGHEPVVDPSTPGA